MSVAPTHFSLTLYHFPKKGLKNSYHTARQRHQQSVVVCFDEKIIGPLTRSFCREAICPNRRFIDKIAAIQRVTS
jgi:hypothetical protein